MEILPQLLVNALITGSIYALASSGLALTYGLLRILNFAHGHCLMVGAYLYLLAAVDLNLPLPIAALVTVLAAVLFSTFVLTIFVLPFTRYNSILTLVTTLALAYMLEAVVSMLFGVNVRALPFDGAATGLEFHGIYITPLQIGIIFSALTLLVALAFLIHSTAWGRRIRALSEHAPAAESLGISQRRASYVVFAIAIFLSTLAGVLMGYETNLQPTMGNGYTIKAFAAMTLGGLGNVWGTVAGSYLLGLVENLSIGLDFGDYSIPAGYKDAFAYLIILMILLFRPQGLFVRAQRAV